MRTGMRLTWVMAGWVVMHAAAASGAYAIETAPANTADEMKAEKQKIMDQILGELNLTQEQITAIDERRRLHVVQKDENSRKQGEMKESLRRALDAAETDRAEIDSLIQQMGELQTERIKIRTETILAVKEVLSPEQYAELQQRKKEFRQQLKEKWQQKEESRV